MHVLTKPETDIDSQTEVVTSPRNSERAQALADRQRYEQRMVEVDRVYMEWLDRKMREAA